jgi:2-methylcitrate dehydratase PrpD
MNLLSAGTESGEAGRGATLDLARFATQVTYASLPKRVKVEAVRAFLNWMGCVLGGCRDPAVEVAVAELADRGGKPQSSLIGHGTRSDVASAAFVNCLSSTVLSFDDTHLETVTHPTGPVAAALFALAEKQPIVGEEFLAALAVGIEIECRISNALLRKPAQANLGFFVTGLSGPIGAAAAIGNLLEFDEQQMASAMGLAAAQSSGFRATHGSMAAFFIPAHAARGGVSAAMLASKGFTCTNNVLESARGFVDVFGRGGDLDHATRGLGEHFELLANAYKPYPSGIVVHPAIDACLEIAEQLEVKGNIEAVHLKVHPLALELTGRRDPATPVEAQISLFHWASACLIQRAAGIAQLRQDCIDDPAVVALRAHIVAAADSTLQRDEAIAEVTLANGRVLRSHVAHARGSVARPMADDELDRKFESQAATVLSAKARTRLLQLCRNLAEVKSVGAELGAVLED